MSSPSVLSIPKIEIGRSKFNRPFRNITTWNNGDIIPLMVDTNITPGDTIECPISAIVRMQTPIYPVLDNMMMDVAAFFVPDRLLWKHFKEFWGENNTTFWEQPIEYEIPQINAPVGGWTEGSLADYFGIPTKVDGFSVSHEAFRAYCKIWNDFYRDENLKEPCFFNEDETTLTGKNKTSEYDYTSDTQLGAAPMKAAKLADYFTKSLPEPQRGPDVALPLGTTAPVYGNGIGIGFTDGTDKFGMGMSGSSSDLTPNKNYYGQEVGTNITTAPRPVANKVIGVTEEAEKSGLVADLSQALGTSVSALRTSIALQRYYEALARSGSRYIEILSGIFGVESSDGRLQRAEFLGGLRVPVNMTQVLANTESGTDQKVGSTGAMSQTIINDYLFTKSFEEHGVLMILGVCRTEKSYQQGLHRMWSRKKQTDFYNRAFDHLSEMAVLNKEIYLQGNEEDNEVFGYMPAFEDMRLGHSIITGEMRSNAQTSLDAWHYAEDYLELPTLSSGWIDEPLEQVDRTISISSEISNQLFGDFYFDMKYTRGMSLYGEPGFMDHM